jgi:hypothetical protein
MEYIRAIKRFTTIGPKVQAFYDSKLALGPAHRMETSLRLALLRL